MDDVAAKEKEKERWARMEMQIREDEKKRKLKYEEKKAKGGDVQNEDREKKKREDEKRRSRDSGSYHRRSRENNEQKSESDRKWGNDNQRRQRSEHRRERTCEQKKQRESEHQRKRDDERPYNKGNQKSVGAQTGKSKVSQKEVPTASGRPQKENQEPPQETLDVMSEMFKHFSPGNKNLSNPSSSLRKPLGNEDPKQGLSWGERDEADAKDGEVSAYALQNRNAEHNPWKKMGSREIEKDVNILRKRQRQIDIGKGTDGYKRYMDDVKRIERTPHHPRTPDKHTACSTRSWQGVVRVWRRKLHFWDPPEVAKAQQEKFQNLLEPFSFKDLDEKEEKSEEKSPVPDSESDGDMEVSCTSLTSLSGEVDEDVERDGDSSELEAPTDIELETNKTSEAPSKTSLLGDLDYDESLTEASLFS